MTVKPHRSARDRGTGGPYQLVRASEVRRPRRRGLSLPPWAWLIVAALEVLIAVTDLLAAARGHSVTSNVAWGGWFAYWSGYATCRGMGAE